MQSWEGVVGDDGLLGFFWIENRLLGWGIHSADGLAVGVRVLTGNGVLGGWKCCVVTIPPEWQGGMGGGSNGQATEKGWFDESVYREAKVIAYPI
jgi:hypothetical protein